MDMLRYQELVRDFTVAVGNPVGDYGNPRLSRPLFRAELIHEEAEETCSALAMGDMVSVIDGLCDLAYVAYGAGVEFGVNVLDPEHFVVAPRITLSYATLYSRLITTKVAAVCKQIFDASIYQGVSWTSPGGYLSDLSATCFFAAAQMGVDLDPFFREVHRSNLTKAGGPRRADGKIMKGADFEPARIRAMLLERGWKPALDILAA
jgi:predicted HAD superfamily Cof-like phosphohydrolase